MTSLFLGQIDRAGVPADEKVVRNTATPVYVDKPAAEMPDMPETQEVRTDGDPNLGMAPRQLASKWHEGERADAPDNTVAMQNASNQLIAQQVSTSGTAAARELAGNTHKNLSYAVGIEPVHDLQDPNHKMGNTYFVRNERTIQEPAGNMMSVPPGMNSPADGAIAQYGKTAAREASQSSMYSVWWNTING